MSSLISPGYAAAFAAAKSAIVCLTCRARQRHATIIRRHAAATLIDARFSAMMLPMLRHAAPGHAAAH
jgi:hypothetical protein